ncbi:MAG: cytidine deaminase [Clostridia bacterium]|nr:cytidine deaminase [Clostridia bacterium]
MFRNMDKDFEILYNKARELTGKKELNKSVQYAHVGCALMTDKGNIYTGICIVANCGIGFCAEHAAIAEMLKKNESRILKIVATDKNGAVPPCGRCRELMKQVNYDNLKTKIMISNDKIVELDELLPHVWLP